jgi:membrane protease YdiL (CAAX protease family)
MRPAALWVTALAIVPIWPVTASGPHLGFSQFAGAVAFVIVGSVLFFGIVVPRLTGLSLRAVGWSRFEAHQAMSGIAFGCLLALAVWPTPAWQRLLTVHLSAQLWLLLFVRLFGVAWQEETLFRGYVQTVLKPSGDAEVDRAIWTQAALASAATAAAALGYVALAGSGPSGAFVAAAGRQAAFQMLLGLTLGYAKEIYDNLWFAYFAHLAYTILGTVFSEV